LTNLKKPGYVPQVRLITFGGGTNDYRQAAERIVNQAKAFPEINDAISYTESDLDAGFYDLFWDIDHQKTRGFGFWSWKPFLIKRALESLNNGDILIYVDAGAELNSRGHARFVEYLDYTAREDFLCFAMPLQHRDWCKQAPELNLGPEFYFRNQLSAAFLMMRKSSKTIQLVDHWLMLSSLDGGKLLKDPTGLEIQENLKLKDHRHDQALLTVSVFLLGMPVKAPDETYFNNWSLGSDYPVLLLRNRQGESILEYRISKGVRRFLFNLFMPWLASPIFKYHVRNVKKRLLGSISGDTNGAR